MACLASLVVALGWHAVGSAESIDERQIWSAGSGHMELEIRGDYLPDFGIEVLHNGEPITHASASAFPVIEIEPLRVNAPWGYFDSLVGDSGRLSVQTGLVLRHGNREVSIDRLQIIPDERDGHPLLVAMDERGNKIFTMSHIHLVLNRNAHYFQPPTPKSRRLNISPMRWA